MPAFVPERGDLIWIVLDPQAGHEQAGRRPAVVVSPRAYNRKVGLALCCPITSRIKGYPFEVALPPKGEMTGVVLADQVKSLDWRARQAKRAGHLTAEAIGEVIAKLTTLLSD